MVNFSISAQNMRSSEIRKLMKLAADPSIISFAGGMPNNNLFPCDIIEDLYNNLTLEEKQAGFQYCPTSGYPPLIAALKNYLSSKGLPIDKNRLIITTGAQQAINIFTKILIDPGDIVLTEYPSFIGAIAAFKSYSAKLIGIEMDNDGIIINSLEKVLNDIGHYVKMLYICPFFHNPAGIIYSHKRKNDLLELAAKYDIYLLEDDPYSELYFDPRDKELTRPLKSIGDESLQICYVGSFAKILGPGMRLGYLLGPEDIIEKCELAKQSMDACSSTFTQVLAKAFLDENKLNRYLETLRLSYKKRAGIMIDALEEYMPDSVSWTRPKGGFYIWVVLPENVDSSKVFTKSLDMGAAFVIGNAFDPEEKRNNCFRLAFSHTPEEKITDGIKIVAEAVRSYL